MHHRKTERVIFSHRVRWLLGVGDLLILSDGLRNLL
jgi:hypothetical protein